LFAETGFVCCFASQIKRYVVSCLMTFIKGTCKNLLLPRLYVSLTYNSKSAVSVKNPLRGHRCVRLVMSSRLDTFAVIILDKAFAVSNVMCSVCLETKYATDW